METIENNDQIESTENNIPEIKNLEGLLQIEGDEVRLQALLKFVKKDEKNKDDAIKMAGEVLKRTGDAKLLDELRDELTKIEKSNSLDTKKEK